MAINVPMPDLPLQGLSNAIGKGGNLFSQMMNAKYNNSLHPSGDVANAMYIEQIKNQYGENDPRYLEAKRAHDMALSGRQSLIDYRGILNQTAGIRATSPLGKLMAEGKGQGATDILRGNQDGTGNASQAPNNARYKVGEQYYNEEGEPVYDKNPRTPEEKRVYEQAIGKLTTDAEARNTYLRAQNLDKTRNSINVDDLTRYSGLKGTGQYLIEAAKATAGHPSEEFLAHNQAINSASLMADQMRQFYKDSIQPSAMDRLRHLSNPSTWYKNPKVAKAQWEQLNKVLDQETETYKQAGTSPIKLNKKIDFKDGKFLITQDKKNAKAEQASNMVTNKEEEQLLVSFGPQLLQMNPKWTAANIKSTAKETGKNIGQVIDALMAKGK